MRVAYQKMVFVVLSGCNSDTGNSRFRPALQDLEHPASSSDLMLTPLTCGSRSAPCVSAICPRWLNLTLSQVVEGDGAAGGGGLPSSGGAAVGGSNQSSENINLHREQRRLDDLVFQSGIRLAQSTRKASKVPALTIPCRCWFRTNQGYHVQVFQGQ